MFGTTPSHFQKKQRLSELPAVDMQHAPAKLPFKLDLFKYADFLEPAHSDCALMLGLITL